MTSRSFDAPDMVYPTAFYYLVGLVTAALCKLRLVGTSITESPDVVALVRVISATTGVAAVGLVGLIGHRLGGRAVGLAAAALMAVVPFLAMQAHLAAVDQLLILTAAVTLLLALDLARKPTMARALLAGGAAGAGFATKYTALAFLVPVLWAVAEGARARRRLDAAFGMGIAACVGFAAAVTALCPPCVLRPDLMVAAMRFHQNLAEHASMFFPNNHLVPTLGWYGRPYAYQLVASLPFVLGWPLHLLALASVVLALRRHDRGDRIVLAMLAPYFLAIGWSSSTFPRHLDPLVPGLVALAPRAVLGRPTPVRVTLLALVWLYTAGLAASHVARFSTDQQHEVAQWIAAHVRPSGDERVRVAAPPMRRADYYQLRNALRQAGLLPIRTRNADWLAGAPDAFVLPQWMATAVRRDSPDGPQARQVERLGSGMSGYHLGRNWPPTWYLDHALYEWLDPAFAGDL